MEGKNQTQKDATLLPKDNILAISWNIATEPKLYRELAPNLYSQRSLQIISERFPDIGYADVIRAVVLAEPEGNYERNFRHIVRTQLEEEKTGRQGDMNSTINKALSSYYKKHAKELHLKGKEFAYETLSWVVFKTADPYEIELKFTQNQRRNFRLSIVNFIEITQNLSATRLQKSPLPKRKVLKILFASIILTFAFSLAQMESGDTTSAPETKNQALANEAQEKKQSLPVRLKIPSINVNAQVEHVGLTTIGAMEVPSNTLDVGWFELGPRPGETGSAVLAGHFNAENNARGVFSDLGKLRQGDKIYIEDQNGETISFVVRTIRTYDPGYAEDVFSKNDSAHLNLITCDGVWDDARKTYSKRLVVFADIAYENFE